MSKRIVDENGKVYVEKKKGGCLKTVAIGLLLVFAIAAWASNNDDSTSPTSNIAQTSNSNNTPERTVETTTIEVFDFTATEIIDTFEANELKGKEMYTGKRANITGRVSSIDEMFGQISVTMVTESTDFAITDLQFFFDKNNTAGLSDLSVGDTVTIQGTIGEKSINVHIEDSVLIQ